MRPAGGNEVSGRLFFTFIYCSRQTKHGRLHTPAVTKFILCLFYSDNTSRPRLCHEELSGQQKIAVSAAIYLIYFSSLLIEAKKHFLLATTGWLMRAGLPTSMVFGQEYQCGCGWGVGQRVGGGTQEVSKWMRLREDQDDMGAEFVCGRRWCFC